MKWKEKTTFNKVGSVTVILCSHYCLGNAAIAWNLGKCSTCLYAFSLCEYAVLYGFLLENQSGHCHF